MTTLTLVEMRNDITALRDAARAILSSEGDTLAPFARDLLRRRDALFDGLIPIINRASRQSRAQRERAQGPRTRARDIEMAREFIRTRDGTLRKKSLSSLMENIGQKRGFKSRPGAIDAVKRGLRYIDEESKL